MLGYTRTSKHARKVCWRGESPDVLGLLAVSNLRYHLPFTKDKDMHAIKYKDSKFNEEFRARQ